jgi:hypothetical protein
MIAPEGVWIVRSPAELKSKDVRRHLDWLLDIVEPRSEVIRQLAVAGYQVVILCDWVSFQGRGGPTISVKNMSRISCLGLALRLNLHAPLES